MSPQFPVTELTLRDIVPDLRHFLDESTADVDGITLAGADPHPAFDPAAAPAGEGALLVTFTDPSGRRRVAELQIKASWREDDCWHQHTRDGALGSECTDCGMVTDPNHPDERCPECNAPVTDAISLFGVHTASCPVVMCQCEHVGTHESAAGAGDQGVRAGARAEEHVGLICDECATGHLADYLLEDNGEDQPR